MIEPLSDEQVQAFEKTHGPIYISKTGQGPIYFRRPTRAEIDVTKQVGEQTDGLDAVNQLVRAVTVHPPDAEMLRLVEVFPLLFDHVSDDVLRVARGHEDKRAKKSPKASSAPMVTSGPKG